MSESSRPKYVPGRLRRKQQQRFHGAFTGGFSAGFFNTVGTKEGWKPRDHERDTESNSRVVPQQKLEDFMDEQDHEEWGGPSDLRREFKDSSRQPTATTTRLSTNNNDATIESWMKVTVEPPANVGNRLLRVLGWREGNSSAYVPTNNDNDNQHHDPTTTTAAAALMPEAKMMLSQKRLRKIQLQQERVKIPPPKLDTCGLGFEPYQNAPEFQAFREKRRQQAQQRARLGQHTKDVYRVSNVLKGDAAKSQLQQKEQHTNIASDDPYVSYETVEDFVGHRSVGGSALQDDHDDAYDDQPMTKVSDKVHLDKEEYNTEIYDHSSSSDEETRHKPGTTTYQNSKTSSSNLAGVLSSFAGLGETTADNTSSSNNNNNNNNNSKHGGVTADGRPPLAGFVLGGAEASHLLPTRYKGPDVPLSYEVKRHEFGPNENPMVLKALSRAVQLQVIDEKRQKALQEALRANATSNTPSNRIVSIPPPQRSDAPMAGGTFSGLAVAMKNRFTSVVEQPADVTATAGLRMPSSSKPKEEPKASPEPPQKPVPKQQIQIRRTVHPFVPHRLLCKRFRVPVPLGSASTDHPAVAGRVTEASYFEQEILNSAKGGIPSNQQKKNPSEQPSVRKAGLKELFHEDGTMKEEAFVELAPPPESLLQLRERPPSETYKSIFEPDDPADSDSEDDDKKEDTDEKFLTEAETSIRGDRGNTEQSSKPGLPKAEDKDNKVGSEEPPQREQFATDTAMVEYKGKDKKKKKKKRSKHRKRDSDYYDSESSSSDSQDHRNRKRSKKRSRSVSSDDSSDLSRDSADTDYEREKKRKRRDRKDRKKHKHKKKKKSKRS